MNILLAKLQETITTIIGVVIIVIALNFTIVPLEQLMLSKFLVGALLITIGLGVFLLGIDIAIYPIGKMIGQTILNIKKLWIILFACLFLALIIIMAEPDLHIFANQVDMATNSTISKRTTTTVTGIGMAIMMTIGFLRSIYGYPLQKLLIIIYSLILALGKGVASIKKDPKAAQKDSFGLLAITLPGGIIALMINIIINPIQITSIVPKTTESKRLIDSFAAQISLALIETTIALLPIVLMYLIFKRRVFKLTNKQIQKINIGIIYTFIGFVIFIIGVNGGFIEVA